MINGLQWEAHHVTRALEAAVCDAAPREQMLVGLDARVALPLGRWLPPALFDIATAAGLGWWAAPPPQALLDAQLSRALRDADLYQGDVKKAD